MTQIRRSVLLSAIDRYIAQILIVVTMAVTARLMTPAEIGIYFIASAFILLADNYRSFGVGAYIIQAPDLDRQVVRSAFTVTLIVSIAMAIGIHLSARLIAVFYREPELEILLRVAALGFLIMPFGTPIVALLQRELDFATIAKVNISAAAANAATTLWLASNGAGPISFVWGFLASNAILSLLAFAFRPQWWIFRPTLTGARQVISFGALSSLVTVVNMAYDLLPRLALGRILGFDAVGIYARAVTVCQLPDRVVVSALQPVVLPAMAARVRAKGNLKATYLRGLSLMSALQWPALVLLALLADPVVRILLGSQWSAATPLVRMIALASMMLAPAFMTFPVLVASGRLRDTLLSSLIALPPSVLIVIGVAPFGLTAVALTTFIVAPMQMVVALYFVRRATGLTWSELAAATRASVCVAIGTAVVPGIVVLLSPHGFALGWVETALAVAGAALGWLTALRLVRHPIGAEFFATQQMLVAAAGRWRRAVPAQGTD